MELQLSLAWPCTILCFVFFILLIQKLRKGSLLSNSKLPPGPWKLPLIGNLHQMIGTQPHIALRDLANKYGDFMYLQLGEIPTVVVSSREYAEEVMKTHDLEFASRPKLNVTKVVSFDFSSISFAPYGEYWRQLRKICVLELLSTRRVQSFGPIREEEASKVIKWVYSKTGSSINLSEKIFSSTFNTVSKMTFGGIADNKADEFVRVVQQINRLLAGFDVRDVFPSVKLFHLISGVGNNLEKVNEKSSKILGDIIDQHIKAKSKSSENQKKGEKEDLVDVLLKFHGSEDNGSFTLSMDSIKAVIQEVFGAGGDTSSATIDYAMTEMIMNPRVMEKAQAEVRQVLDNKLIVDEAKISEMKYLKLVIKETLRFHPPVPLLLPRENNERCCIDRYELPAKTRVLVNAFSIGRDPKYWGRDAERFYPERFLDNPVDFKGRNFEYIPFGGGRRMCPGMTFGLSNVECLLSQLLYHFDWKLPVGMTPQDLDMADTFGLSMRRRDDLYLIPTPYRSSHVSES